MTVRELAEGTVVEMMGRKMEQVLKRPPWWAWFSLMGLEIPSAAIAWAFAVSQSHLVVVSSPWLYQFLFVAVWCVNMLDRVLKIFRSGSAVHTDECLLFAKKHCFVISLLIMVAAVTGLWIMFFQLGVVIFQFAFLPGVCSLLFLYFSSNPHQKGILSSGFVMGAFFAAVSFATGAGIPAYFYGTVGGGWGGQLSEPTWYLVALVMLCMFSRKRWSEEEEEDGQDSADRDMVSLVWMGVTVIYVVFCLAAAAREYTGDAWIYYGLAMAGAFMFVLDRLKRNMPPLLLYTLSWAALIFALLLSGILAQASS
ncbi:hypothetical protein [uncultured Akkermansia sp.]|uniref:hypothetical protein n=2 Tax=uncultured Akkermansia sp. TaxID=512294 RepID=UPI00260EF940|nr:hypothetical protein [uncultured Akkermansia sp.]